MKIIFKDYFIKNHFTLFLISLILTILMISLIVYIGIKVIKKK